MFEIVEDEIRIVYIGNMDECLDALRELKSKNYGKTYRIREVR